MGGLLVEGRDCRMQGEISEITKICQKLPFKSTWQSDEFDAELKKTTDPTTELRNELRMLSGRNMEQPSAQDMLYVGPLMFAS